MTNGVLCNVDVLVAEFSAALEKGVHPSTALQLALSIACASADTALTAGARLRVVRVMRKMTQRDLSDIIAIGHLSEFENGKRHAISMRILDALCKRLNTRVEWVTDGELPIEPKNPAAHEG